MGRQTASEIVKLFEENQFGRAPGRPIGMTFDVAEKAAPAFDGKAIRRQITIYFDKDKSGPHMDLLVYLPANSKVASHLLFNVGFAANNLMVNDPGVKVGRSWNAQLKQRSPAEKGNNFGGFPRSGSSKRVLAPPRLITPTSIRTRSARCRTAYAVFI